ncbi:MAG: DHHW family protein, partial [Hominenteromicrobium sp.]
VVKVDTEVKNGRKLLVVKDSFGNAEIPYYTSSFEQIYVVDVREFQRNLVNFIDTTGVTDVLFTMSAYSVVGTNASNITNLIHQDADSIIVDEHPTGNAAVSTPAPDSTGSDDSVSADPAAADDDDPQA